MKTRFALRTGRTLLILAVILFLASSTALAGEKGSDRIEQKQRMVVVVIKISTPEPTAPSAAQAKENKNVPYVLIQTGVELLKRSLRWLKKDGNDKDTWVLFFRSG